MKLSEDTEDLIKKYVEKKYLNEIMNNMRSEILHKFSEHLETDGKVHTNKKELMNFWLDAHVGQYYSEVQEYCADDWESDVEVWIPIHGVVHLKPEIQFLLSLPIIQRCNGIKQLSTAYTIYPGAKHTRDEHQLGTLFLMQLICRHLIKEKAINENEQVTLEVAALIHDIAHPPYGHSLDPIKEILIPKRIYSYDKKIDKSLLNLYLTDDKFQLKKAIESIDTINIDLLKSVLLFENDSDHFSPAYCDLIDSKVDIDRMDYLQRDALHTGRNDDFDPTKIQHMIDHSHFCELTYKNKRGITGTRISLGFDVALTSTLTQFLRTRRNMYAEIYEADDKVILDEVIVHAIYHTLLRHYNFQRNDVTEKLLFLTDCQLDGFLEFFSPNSIYNVFNSQLSGKLLFSSINKYLLVGDETDFLVALKDAVTTYSKLSGFLNKYTDEIEFSKKIGATIGENDIPPILFCLPHYLPKEEPELEDDEREGLKNDLVIIKDDGTCGYFKDISIIEKERDPSLNKFILICKKDIGNQDKICEQFEEYILENYGETK